MATPPIRSMACTWTSLINPQISTSDSGVTSETLRYISLD